MAHAQEEAFLHFSMDLEFLSRCVPKWRFALQNIVFQEGDLTQHAEQGEDAEDKV
jgi:hypothetical protein